ncbi:MAG: aminotransferase class V-fold PLP-dependent enzyme [Myxococcota bacterium]|nr:aminotransferase class V-fold PLP-dependent enzyme [Myxococcota bacterium]
MDWERTRAFFPVLEELLPLDHAGRAPLSTRAGDALVRYAHQAARAPGARPEAFETDRERVRGRAARLLGATPEEVAFVRNTTAGLGLVARGLAWRPGDRVVTSALEYPSNVTVWLGLRDQGVETRLLPERDGRLELEDLARALEDPGVRLVSLSSVAFASGDPLDLPRAGRLCAERGVLFCVDAIQSVGLLPVDVRAAGIDFLAAGGQKWLCAGEGAGLLYCARERLRQLAPPVLGWRNVRDVGDAPPYPTTPLDTAMRFEEGAPNTPGILALGAAIDLALELGVERIAARVETLTRRLAEGLAAAGAELVAPRPAGRTSGIVAFRRPDEEPAQTAARLAAGDVVARVRRGAVRLAPHYYLRESEMDAVVGLATG